MLFNDRSIPFLVTGLILWLTVTLSLGCREDLIAPENVDYPFSMYGVLSPQLDTQSVLVYPVQGIPHPLPREPLDAVVTSTDLTTGEVRAWKDSVTVDSLGFYEHVFWSDFRAEHGHRYRIEVVRSDGARSYAETHVPPPLEAELVPSPLAYQDLHILAPDIRVHTAEVEYRVLHLNPRRGPHIDEKLPAVKARVSYAGEEREIEGGWVVRVDLREGYFRSLEAFCIEYGCVNWIDQYDSLAFVDMTIRMVVGDADWSSPGGVFDPNVVGHPKVMSNVENGLGFVGAGYRIGHLVLPPPEALREAGFAWVPHLIN